ncbi:lactoylglutathione lyase Glo1 [Pseudohyphozyma bogoriensis]|nr:lactoylglutathione lyase Glo1 [Pseudohyphozyma bogoriensis]
MRPPAPLRSALKSSRTRTLPAKPPAQVRLFSRGTTFSPKQATSRTAWIGAGALAGGTLAYSLWDLKHELLPSLTVLHAEEAEKYIDPTTSTPFPRHLTSSGGQKLVLVGTGVRTVSFLSVRVYAVGLYIGEQAMEGVRSGTIKGFEDYRPTKMFPPFPKAVTGEPAPLVGEALVAQVLDTRTDAAVMIIPLRSTSLTHLRDAFGRALVARIKLPHVADKLSPDALESATAALTDLRNLFPNKALPKGSPCTVLLNGSKGALTFTTTEAKDASKVEVLGTINDLTLSRQLFLSYFSDGGVISEELRASVAKGCSTTQPLPLLSKTDVGNDPPRPAITKGISLHHCCLRIVDPEPTLKFYREILGMRLLFSYNAGSFSIYYMYHGEEEGEDDTAKVWEKFPDQKGLIELIHRHGTESDPTFPGYVSGNEDGHRGFAHLGLIVDDVPALVKRVEEAGYKVVKPQGVCTVETIGWPTGTPEPIKAYQQLYHNMAMIQDPNGYWLELVPRVLS